MSKIAVVTGGNRGIGRSTALHLAREGVGVILTFRSHADEAAEVVAEIEAGGGAAVALPLDAGDVGAFGTFVDEVRRQARERWQRGHVDFLVNNAGTAHYASFAETTVEDFDAVHAVNVRGVFFLTQALLPVLADGGAIVNLSTGLTRFAFPGRASYAAGKGAIDVLTKHLALELGARGIRVNAFAPGPIATDFGGGQVRDNAELRAGLAQSTALGRVGEADDIGGAIALLLDDRNRWITGQRIEASGGARL